MDKVSGFSSVEADRLYGLLDEARTFYFDEGERVSESVAISHLLTVASHPDLEAIIEAIRRIDRDYCTSSKYGLSSGWSEYQMLQTLLGFVFSRSSDPASRDRPQPPLRLETIDGLLSLHRHEGSLVIAGYVPNVETLLEWWQCNPRRDLSPHLHEIMPPEEARSKRSADGERRAFRRFQGDEADVSRIEASLRQAAGLFDSGTSNAAWVSILTRVATEESIEAIVQAGARTNRSEPPVKNMDAVLSMLPALLFGRRRYGTQGDYPLAPFQIDSGRLVLTGALVCGNGGENWEGEMVVRMKLFERRDLTPYL